MILTTSSTYFNWLCLNICLFEPDKTQNIYTGGMWLFHWSTLRLPLLQLSQEGVARKFASITGRCWKLNPISVNFSNCHIRNLEVEKRDWHSWAILYPTGSSRGSTFPPHMDKYHFVPCLKMKERSIPNIPRLAKIHINMVQDLKPLFL